MKRPHDDVGELLVFGDQPAEVGGGHAGDHAVVPDDRSQVRVPAGEQVELAEEAVRPVNRDDAVLGPVAVDDRDGSLLDDEEVVLLVALAEEHVAGANVLDGAAHA